MAAKPNIALSRWASTGGAELLTPSSGLRDTGFESGTLAEPGYVNELLNRAYAWFQYLNDGVLTGDHTVNGALHVTGTSAFDGASVFGANVTISPTFRLIVPQIEITGKPIFRHGSYRKTYSPLRSHGGGSGTQSPTVSSGGLEYVALSNTGGFIQVHTDDLVPGQRILGIRVSWNINGGSGGGSPPVVKASVNGPCNVTQVNYSIGTTESDGTNLYISTYTASGFTLALDDVSTHGFAGTVADWPQRVSVYIEAASNTTWITGVEVEYSAPVE